MGRPRLHDESTRERLLQVAEGLAAREGSDAVTVRGVAVTAGTSTRAIYSLFGSRDGILGALYSRAFLTLTRAVDSVPTTRHPMRDLVHAGVDGFRSYALAHPNLFRLVFQREFDPNKIGPAALSVAMECLERLRTRVQRCADAGLIPKNSIMTLTLGFDAACRGLATSELNCMLTVPGQMRDPKHVWVKTLEALVAGFQIKHKH